MPTGKEILTIKGPPGTDVIVQYRGGVDFEGSDEPDALLVAEAAIGARGEMRLVVEPAFYVVRSSSGAQPAAMHENPGPMTITLD